MRDVHTWMDIEVKLAGLSDDVFSLLEVYEEAISHGERRPTDSPELVELETIMSKLDEIREIIGRRQVR